MLCDVCVCVSDLVSVIDMVVMFMWISLWGVWVSSVLLNIVCVVVLLLSIENMVLL